MGSRRLCVAMALGALLAGGLVLAVAGDRAEARPAHDDRGFHDEGHPAGDDPGFHLEARPGRDDPAFHADGFPQAPQAEGFPAAALAEVRGEVVQEPAYDGSRSGCMRCHIREYRSWGDTAHATAYETLPEESRDDPDCLRCHVTGWGEETGFQSIEDTPQLAAVGCEACHGPGSLYKDREIMQSRDASVANGLLIPDEETCRGCHNPESPTFPGSFDYEEALQTGVHEISR